MSEYINVNYISVKDCTISHDILGMGMLELLAHVFHYNNYSNHDRFGGRFIFYLTYGRE